MGTTFGTKHDEAAVLEKSSSGNSDVDVEQHRKSQTNPKAPIHPTREKSKSKRRISFRLPSRSSNPKASPHRESHQTLTVDEITKEYEQSSQRNTGNLSHRFMYPS